MLTKRHAAALALLTTLVAPGSFATPAVAQEFPTVAVLRNTTVYRTPGHRPFGQLIKGDLVKLHECTDLPGYCQVSLHVPGRRLTGWVNAAALDGVVTTK